MKNLDDNILREFFEDQPDDDLDVKEPSDDDQKDKKDDKTYTKEDMDKAIARRQAALARAKKAEEKAKALEDKVNTLPDEEEFNTLRGEYEKMKQQLNKLDEERKTAELEKIEDEKERERVKLQREFEKEREKFQSDLNKLQEQITAFNQEKEELAKVAARHRKQALEGSILSASSAKAFNPQQIVRLISHEFVHDEKDDRWYKEIYDNAGKLKEMLTIEEYVEAFLNDPVNENLLKVGVKPGSDTPRGNQQARDTNAVSGREPTDEHYRWAARVGLGINKKSSPEEKAWLIDRFDRLHKRVKKEEGK